jgi:phosphoribosyl 1,2-cyclic phosphodiesterase
MVITINPLSSGSAGNAYLISDGHTNLLLEAGIPWMELQKKTGFCQIDGCLVSHNHLDHAKAAKDILKMGINVYMSSGCSLALGLERHNLIKISAKQHFEINTWIVYPFDVEHDVEEPLGFVLYSTKAKEKVVFITDSMYSKYKFNDVDYWMLEANYSMDIVSQNVEKGTLSKEQKHRILHTHMSLETCIGILEANDLSKTKAVYLLHLSNNNSHEELFKKKVQEVTGKIVIVA